MVAGFILLALLSGIMFLVPPMQVAVSVAAILTSLYFFTRPYLALFSIFVVRAMLDLLWWIPGTILGLNMLQLFSAAVFILVATQLFLDLKRMQTHPCFELFLGFMLLITIAVLRCDSIVANLANIVRYTVPFILFFMVSIHFTDRSSRRGLLYVIACIGVIPVGINLYHFSAGQMNQYTLHGYDRLLGGYKNLHNMALMTLFFTTVWILWIGQVRNWLSTGLLVVISAAAAFTMYKSYIRTSVLGLGVFVLALLYFHRRYRLLGFAGVLGIAGILFSPEIQDRFSDIWLLFDTENITLDKRSIGSGRWGLWTMSMAEYLRMPVWDQILGPGLGQHLVLTLDFVRQFHTRKGFQLDPHNDMLLLLYQIGPFGVLIYLWMQWKVLKIAAEVRILAAGERFATHLAAYVSAMTVMVFVTNIVNNSFIHRTSPGWYYWCICGLLFAEYGQLKRIAAAKQREPLTTVVETAA
jgi:hypothetical protein